MYGAGSTYNLTSHESLAKKIAQLVNLVSIDVENQSCRVCKPCFRRVESLDKKSSVLLLDLQEFRSKFNRNNPKGLNLSQQCETTGVCSGTDTKNCSQSLHSVSQMSVRYADSSTSLNMSLTTASISAAYCSSKIAKFSKI